MLDDPGNAPFERPRAPEVDAERRLKALRWRSLPWLESNDPDIEARHTERIPTRLEPSDKLASARENTPILDRSYPRG